MNEGPINPRMADHQAAIRWQSLAYQRGDEIVEVIKEKQALINKLEVAYKQIEILRLELKKNSK